MYGLDNIWKSEGANNLNSEKSLKVVQMKFLAMHNIRFDIFTVAKLHVTWYLIDLTEQNYINNFDS